LKQKMKRDFSFSFFVIFKMMLPTHRICCKSNFKLHCFVCDGTINRGDEISQVLESRGMEMRRVPYSGSRWVHNTCFPIDGTMYYIDLIDKMQKLKPHINYDDIVRLVESGAGIESGADVIVEK